MKRDRNHGGQSTARSDGVQRLRFFFLLKTQQIISSTDKFSDYLLVSVLVLPSSVRALTRRHNFQEHTRPARSHATSDYANPRGGPYISVHGLYRLLLAVKISPPAVTYTCINRKTPNRPAKCIAGPLGCCTTVFYVTCLEK